MTCHSQIQKAAQNHNRGNGLDFQVKFAMPFQEYRIVSPSYDRLSDGLYYYGYNK